MGSGKAHHRPGGKFEGEAFAIGPVGGHRVERIRHGDDPDLDRDDLSFELVRIACAIPTFVVMANAGKASGQEGHVLEHLVPDQRMLPDVLPFLVRQLAGFREDSVLHPDLADVVQQGAALEGFPIVRRQAERLGDLQAYRCHPGGVLKGVRVASVDRAGQCLQTRKGRVLELSCLGLQGGRHRIERLSEESDFVGRAGRCAVMEVSGRHGFHRTHELLDGPGDARGHRDPDHEGEQRGCGE